MLQTSQRDAATTLLRQRGMLWTKATNRTSFDSIGVPFALRLFPMTALRFAPVVLETRAEPSGRIEGLASTFDGPIDAYGDVVAPGAFKDSLVEHKCRGSMPAMLWAHHQDRPVGRWTDAHETRSGPEVAAS